MIMIKIKIWIIIFFNILYIHCFFLDSNDHDKILLFMTLDGSDIYPPHQVPVYKLVEYQIYNNRNKILYIQGIQIFYEYLVSLFYQILCLSIQIYHLLTLVELLTIYHVDACLLLIYLMKLLDIF